MRWIGTTAVHQPAQRRARYSVTARRSRANKPSSNRTCTLASSRRHPSLELLFQPVVDDRVESSLVLGRQPQIRTRRQARPAHFRAAELVDRPVHQVQPDLRLLAIDQRKDRIVEIAFSEQQPLAAMAGERVGVRPLRPRLAARPDAALPNWSDMPTRSEFRPTKSGAASGFNRNRERARKHHIGNCLEHDYGHGSRVTVVAE